MAYKLETPAEKKQRAQKFERMAVRIAEDENIKFFSHLVSYLPISMSTFIALGLNKSEAIIKALDDNKATACISMVDRWIKPTAHQSLQIKAYQMLSSKREYERLIGQPTEQQETTTNNIVIQVVDKETQQAMEQLQESPTTTDEIPENDFDEEPIDPNE